MNYYNEIKEQIINNEITKRVKDYSKNRSDLNTYYNIGKLLSEASKYYGEGIIKEFSSRLIKEFGKKYNVRYLFDMKKLYLFTKVHPLDAQLTISHYRVLFTLKDNNAVNYYIKQVKERKLGKRDLINIIKNNEYERLPEETKNKLIMKDIIEVKDLVKNPIVIKNTNNSKIISEKILQRLILEDIPSFLEELGSGFTFIKNEYKIKLRDTYNYIDLLLYNIDFNCYVVVELKVTGLKKEHIGQIEEYMNYIDKNIKNINQDKTIGIIICKKNDNYIIEYCSDDRIISKENELV